ncbi:hypothetical protein KEM52_002426, partial [Ascosphaera acerosa]
MTQESRARKRKAQTHSDGGGVERKRRLRRGRRVEAVADNGSDGDSDTVSARPTSHISDDEDEEDIVQLYTPRTRRKAPVTDQQDDEDSEDGSADNVVHEYTPRLKRRRGSTVTAEAPREEGADDDLSDIADELQDLRDSPVRTGPAPGSARAQRQTHLDALRRRRAARGQPQALAEDEAEASSPGSTPDARPNGTAQQPLAIPDDDDEGQSDDVFGAATDDDDLGFIVSDDEENPIGAPDDNLTMLPFEFSRHRYKQSKQFFKDVVEWMVHNQLNPAFPRHDDMYKAAFAKINDEVMGLAASQLISSVWTLPFRRALEARPQLTITPIEAGYDSCDACQRARHPARYEFIFTGEPYSLDTLRPVTQDEDDGGADASAGSQSEAGSARTGTHSSDSEDDLYSGSESGGRGESASDIDRHGNPIPSTDTAFRLGKHCRAKAELAHNLLHWRWELNQWVLDWLRTQEITTEKQVRRRKKWSVRHQTRYANSIVDMMVELKEIDKLWKDFKKTVQYAREAK